MLSSPWMVEEGTLPMIGSVLGGYHLPAHYQSLVAFSLHHGWLKREHYQ